MPARTVRNNANVNILGALKAGIEEIPFEVTGLDFDNGPEFLNHAVIAWAADLKIFFTRSRPYKKNDQATTESKNSHLVRKYDFYSRAGTDAELRVLNQLWRLAGDRFNYLTPTKKPIGFASDVNDKRKRSLPSTATWQASTRRSPSTCAGTRTATCYLADLSILKSSPASRAFYDRKRAEGTSHKQALIALARSRMNVIRAMLRDHAPYIGLAIALPMTA